MNALTVDEQKLQSAIISFLRFPLSVAVVLIHTSIAKEHVNGNIVGDINIYPLYNIIYNFLNTVFFQLAVPIFFFISGYLFFFKFEKFGLGEYFRQIRSRTRTLVVPYLLWNLVVILKTVIAQNWFPALSGQTNAFENFNVSQWLLMFWDVSDVTESLPLPINGPLWFVRNLIVLTIFSPIIYWYVTKVKRVGIIIALIPFLIVTGQARFDMAILSVFFFLCGSWFGINKKCFIPRLSRNSQLVVIGFYIIAAIVMSIYRDGRRWIEALNNVEILIGCYIIILISSSLLEKNKIIINPFLQGSSFFLYAYQALVISFVTRMLFKILNPVADVELVGVYFLSSFIVITGGLILYKSIKLIIPSVANCLTGGR